MLRLTTKSILLLSSCLVLTPVSGLTAEPGNTTKAPAPKVEATGGIRFQSQGAGTANTVSGYLFAPLSQSKNGSLYFLDFSANLNLGGVAPQANTVNAGVSTRLGYRWLQPDQSWIFGVNAGVDTRPAYSQYTFQAGVGAEALSRSLEFRLNGYIPFANNSDLFATGWTNAALTGDRLVLDGYNQYVVAIGGVDFEAGVPLKTWKNGSLWTYAAFYYLNGDYLNGSSGIRGRAEVRVGSQLAIGATVSYDNIFDTQATGYVRYGAKPIAGNPKDTVAQAERNFLALRGLPVNRETDIRLSTAQVDAPNTVALDPSTGQAYIVRCTGTTTSSYQVNCGYANALDALNAGASNAVLIANGTPTNNLGGQTLRLAPGTSLTNGSNAPTLNTQFGPASLQTIFGTSRGPAPSFNNGVISIGSNTTIAGLSLTDTTITNYSTSNVLIANNQFTGSYSPTPGLSTYNANALPAVQLVGVNNVTISGNTFTNPNLQSYRSAKGTDENTGQLEDICGRAVTRPGFTKLSGICLSGNAIRMTNGGNYSILNNTITGALDEAIRLDNPNGNILVKGNTISGMRMGPDTNIGATIFVRQNAGISNILIEQNTVIANDPGKNLIADMAGNSLASGVITPVKDDTEDDFGNVIDALEVGLCRGRVSFPRADDLYGDADILPQDCSPGSPPTMNYTAKANILIPSTNASKPGEYDYDGIDFNIGSYSTFNSYVSGNTVIVNTAGNAFTSDFRGQNFSTVTIAGNNFSSQNEPIDILTQTITTPTPFSAGTINIFGNTLENFISGRRDSILKITTASFSLTQSPVQKYFINAPGYTAGSPEVKAENARFGTNVKQPDIYFNGEYILPTRTP